MRRAAGGFIGLIAWLVRLVVGIVVAIIVIGILMVVLEANEANGIVQAVTDAAEFLVGPFKNLFTLDSEKWTKALNWGIAALVYSIVGGFIASLLGGLGGAARGRRRGLRRGRTTR